MFGNWWTILIFKMIKISLWSTEMQMHLGQSRSSHWSCYLKAGVLKNFVIFPGNLLGSLLIKLLGSLLNKVAGLQAYEYCEILKATLKPFWKNKNNFEDHSAYDCFWLSIQTALFFSFSKNVINPNHLFTHSFV